MKEISALKSKIERYEDLLARRYGHALSSKWRIPAQPLCCVIAANGSQRGVASALLSTVQIHKIYSNQNVIVYYIFHQLCQELQYAEKFYQNNFF